MASAPASGTDAVAVPLAQVTESVEMAATGAVCTVTVDVVIALHPLALITVTCSVALVDPTENVIAEDPLPAVMEPPVIDQR